VLHRRRKGRALAPVAAVAAAAAGSADARPPHRDSDPSSRKKKWRAIFFKIAICTLICAAVLVAEPVFIVYLYFFVPCWLITQVVPSWLWWPSCALSEHSPKLPCMPCRCVHARTHHPPLRHSPPASPAYCATCLWCYCATCLAAPCSSLSKRVSLGRRQHMWQNVQGMPCSRARGYLPCRASR
jgi:hypothetical protein